MTINSIFKLSARGAPHTCVFDIFAELLTTPLAHSILPIGKDIPKYVRLIPYKFLNYIAELFELFVMVTAHISKEIHQPVDKVKISSHQNRLSDSRRKRTTDMVLGGPARIDDSSTHPYTDTNPLYIFSEKGDYRGFRLSQI